MLSYKTNCISGHSKVNASQFVRLVLIYKICNLVVVKQAWYPHGSSSEENYCMVNHAC